MASNKLSQSSTKTELKPKLDLESRISLRYGLTESQFNVIGHVCDSLRGLAEGLCPEDGIDANCGELSVFAEMARAADNALSRVFNKVHKLGGAS